MDVNLGNADGDYLNYPNVPSTVGFIISSDKSMLAPLCTLLGTEDLWDIMEVIQVDAHNRRLRERQGD